MSSMESGAVTISDRTTWEWRCKLREEASEDDLACIRGAVEEALSNLAARDGVASAEQVFRDDVFEVVVTLADAAPESWAWQVRDCTDLFESIDGLTVVESASYARKFAGRQAQPSKCDSMAPEMCNLDEKDSKLEAALLARIDALVQQHAQCEGVQDRRSTLAQIMEELKSGRHPHPEFTGTEALVALAESQGKLASGSPETQLHGSALRLIEERLLAAESRCKMAIEATVDASPVQVIFPARSERDRLLKCHSMLSQAVEEIESCRQLCAQFTDFMVACALAKSNEGPPGASEESLAEARESIRKYEQIASEAEERCRELAAREQEAATKAQAAQEELVGVGLQAKASQQELQLAHERAAQAQTKCEAALKDAEAGQDALLLSQERAVEAEAKREAAAQSEARLVAELRLRAEAAEASQARATAAEEELATLMAEVVARASKDDESGKDPTASGADALKYEQMAAEAAEKCKEMEDKKKAAEDKLVKVSLKASNFKKEKKLAEDRVAKLEEELKAAVEGAAKPEAEEGMQPDDMKKDDIKEARPKGDEEEAAQEEAAQEEGGAEAEAAEGEWKEGEEARPEGDKEEASQEEAAQEEAAQEDGGAEAEAAEGEWKEGEEAEDNAEGDAQAAGEEGAEEWWEEEEGAQGEGAAQEGEEDEWAIEVAKEKPENLMDISQLQALMSSSSKKRAGGSDEEGFKVKTHPHPLKPFNDGNRRWVCDDECASCSRIVEGPKVRWSCRECEYDMCRGCVDFYREKEKGKQKEDPNKKPWETCSLRDAGAIGLPMAVLVAGAKEAWLDGTLLLSTTSPSLEERGSYVYGAFAERDGNWPYMWFDAKACKWKFSSWQPGQTKSPSLALCRADDQSIGAGVVLGGWTLSKGPKDTLPMSVTALSEEEFMASEARLAVPLDVTDVLEVVSNTALNLMAEDEIHLDTPLMENGMTSAAAVQFRQLLNSELAINLPATLMFDHPNMRSIGQYIVDLSKQQ